MRKQQTLSALLLAGTIILSPSLVGQEQELKQGELVHEEGTGVETEAMQPITEEPNVTSMISKADMVKAVLGTVFTEINRVGMSEQQWFDLEPVAMKYVDALYKARTMINDAAATQLAQTAWANFEAAVEEKLTTEQKNERTKWRSEVDAWNRDAKEYITSPAVRDTIRQQLGSKSGTVIMVYDK